MPTLLLFFKAYIPEHQRRLKNGKVVTVAAYYDKRIKKAAIHAPDHNHDVSHLSDADKAKFSNMHKEQHVAHYYEHHALKRKLSTEEQLRDTLKKNLGRYEASGDKKSAAITRKKIAALSLRIGRHKIMLERAAKITEGIGKLKDKLVEGSGNIDPHKHDKGLLIEKQKEALENFRMGHAGQFIEEVKHYQNELDELEAHDDKQHVHYVGKLGARFKGNKAVIEISSVEIGADIQDRKACKEKVLGIIRPTYQDNPKKVTTHDGDKIIIAWNGVKHAMNAGLPTWQESAAALHIGELIANSSAVQILPDKLGRNDPKSTTIYQAKAKFDGVPHQVSIFVRNHSDGNRYYDHVTIEGKSPAGLTGSETPTLPFTGDNQGNNNASDKSIAPSEKNTSPLKGSNHGYTKLSNGNTVANRTVYYPGLSVSKLNRLLSKENLSGNDIEALKDYKFMLLFDKQSAKDKGFMNFYEGFDNYGVKNVFWITNIDSRISGSGGNPQELANNPLIADEPVTVQSATEGKTFKIPGQPSYTYARPSTIDTPAQGVLNGAREGKKAASKRVSGLRERIRNEPLNGNRLGLRLELLRAQDKLNEYRRAETDAIKGIEKRANQLGLTTIKPKPLHKALGIKPGTLILFFKKAA